MTKKPTYEDLEKKVKALQKESLNDKRKIKNLQETEEIFKHFLEHSPVYVFFKDENIRSIRLSKNYEKMIGRPADQILGKSMYDLFPSDLAKSMVADDMQILKEDKTITVEEELNGRFYTTTKFPIHIEGKPTYLAGFTTDITDRKIAEEALRESEERFRKIFEEAHLGIIIFSPSFELLKANPAFCRMIGYSADEIYSIDFNDITPQDNLKKDIENINKVGRKEIPVYQTEKGYINKSGKKLWGELIVSGIFDNHGALQYYLAMIGDITERKHMEEVLRKSEERYNALFERSLELVYLCDFEGNFIDANNTAIELLGYRKKDIKSLNFSSLLSDDQMPLALKKVEEILKTGSQKKVAEYKLRSKDGKAVYVETKGTLLYREGRPYAIQGIARNITDRKRAEEEKQILEERLNRAEKMESLGLLAGGVAHDLNNVLGIVIGYAELLLCNADHSNSIRSKLETIMEGCKKAAAIIQDLLTLARRGVSGKDIINLNMIVTDNQKSPEFSDLLFHHPDVKVKIELDPELLNISGSSVHLSKTVFNLLSNASEAMPKGGVITIKTANQYINKPLRGYDEIQDGDYVVLSVSDTGEGISASDLKRIFEPFYTKKVMGRSGTGLGLAVVWGTVKDHNGYINVQSKKGKGSTFALYFPITMEELSAEHVTVSISEYMGKGESILIVDDIKGQRALAEEMLKKLNYSVTSASNGEEAVAYLKEYKVDLVVLDMIMGLGMDGLDTYRSMLEIYPQQKAIIVSGFSESDRVKATQDLGAGTYLRKPYVIEKLGLAVRKELDRAT